ncbi:glucose-6-phosphatase catalytic subunit 1-like [Homarus americanus]|uniref:Glucose-6-phosphatase-like 1 n=1 Tax=Homarus americanus TaxID=6706 RepID=A0A8J5N1J3_HOMAM|nr:glucose-6-phosphatase catalytic subunit 1-like [Homarus americanus]XP_042217108.1 glucose-6-phosphatase catalytic subunit 1-like [Homarus americanus]KAG7171520.1 Glucose-6-phosphatase-like 1 [Homarus americanus]
MESLVDTYHQWGAELISTMQRTFPGSALFFMKVSDAGDPSLAFTFYFPLVVALHAGIGVRLMWSIIFCEWSNMILKWVMAGDRPYWWVHETKLYAHRVPPYVHQFPGTCETGPGMPSGHAKLNAAMFYVLASAFCELVVKRTSLHSTKQQRWACRGIWAAYGVWLVLVVVSRTYMAAHFPHQCVAGALIGLMIAVLVPHFPALQVLSRRKYLALTATIIVTVLGTYFSYKAMGGNVLWSLEKAVKWCVRREYIHVDSTPFYSFSRYSGVSLGLGLGLSSPMYKKANRARFSYKMILSLVIVSLAVSQAGVFAHKSLKPTMTGWYLAEFTLNAVVTFVLVAGLPHLVRVASKVAPGEKFKKK